MLALTAALGGCATDPPRINASDQWTKALANLDIYAIYPMQEDLHLGDILLVARPQNGGTQTGFDAARLTRVRPNAIEAALCAHARGRPRLVAEPAKPEPPAPTAGTTTQEARLSIGGGTASATGSGASVRIPVAGGVATATAGRPAPPQTRQPTPPPTQQPEQASPCKEPVVVRPETAEADTDRANKADAESNTTGTARVARLRAMAMPTVTVARVTQAAFSGAGLFGNVGAALGLGTSSSVALTIRLESIQESAIDSSTAFGVLREQAYDVMRRVGPDGLLFNIDQASTGAAKALCEAPNPAALLEQRGIELVLPTRVVYARSVTYEFSRESATALDLALNLAKVTTTRPPATELPGGTTALDPRPAASPAPEAGSAAGASEDIAKRLDGILTVLGAARPTTPGVSTSIGVGTSGGLRMVEKFDQPMAAGLGGLFRINPLDALALAHVIHGNDPRRSLSASCEIYGVKDAPLVAAAEAARNFVVDAAGRRSDRLPMQGIAARSATSPAPPPGRVSFR
jgi:hypothetical protein